MFGQTALIGKVRLGNFSLRWYKPLYKIIRQGSKARLVWGADGSGRYRGLEYYEALSTADQAKFEPWFERLAELGHIHNNEKFRKEWGEIFVFKVFKHRLPCFFDARDVVIIDGFSKKSDKSKAVKRQIETAIKLRRAYLEQKTKESS